MTVARVSHQEIVICLRHPGSQDNEDVTVSPQI
jgi:hypothetical protein